MSGAEATARALEAMPSVGVVMLTINQEDHRVVEAIRPGAAGYLVKDADLDDIAAGIRTAANSSWAPAATRSVMAELRQHASGAGALPGAAPHRTRARRAVPAAAAPRKLRSAAVSST